MIDCITNRDPRWAGIMAQIEADDDPRARFLAWQRLNYMRSRSCFSSSTTTISRRSRGSNTRKRRSRHDPQTVATAAR
jgi:hypothetical protein